MTPKWKQGQAYTAKKNWGSHIDAGRSYILKEIKLDRGIDILLFSSNCGLLIPFFAETQTVLDIFDPEENSPSKQDLKQVAIQWAKALGIKLG